MECNDLTIEITNLCPLNCIHCSVDSKNEGDIFVKISEIEKILEELQKFEKIRLSGGEPTMHPEIIKISELIKSKGKFLEILSSGIYHKQSFPLEFLSELSVFADKIVFPIYGKNSHDIITRTSNSYNTLMNSIDNTIKTKLTFIFQTVAMKESFSDLEKIFAEISRIKTETDYCEPTLHILRFIKQGRALENLSQHLEREEILKMIEESKKFSSFYGVKVSFGCSLLESGCNAGRYKSAVSVYGERVSCSALKYSSPQGKFACKNRW